MNMDIGTDNNSPSSDQTEDQIRDEKDGLTLFEDKVKLTALEFDSFKETLSNLYIKNNMSGRLNFLKNCTPAAHYILGDELIACDTEGAEDKERRADLEEQAEERHLELMEIAETFHAKSIEGGALALSYVEPLIQKLGRDLALLFYLPEIVDRIIPPAPRSEPEATPEETVEVTPEAIQEEKSEEEALPSLPSSEEDPFVNIKPIDS